jgi:PAS domain S-box-containing protein
MSTRSILIVEDERIIARDIQAILQRLGYDVPAISTTGADALAKTAAHRPDLLLIDIRLRGAMDGIQVAEAICARFDIPVVFLTAFADDATRQRAWRIAPYGYLVKPFDERTLQTTIEAAFERHKRDQQLRASEQWLTTTLRSIGDAVVTSDPQGRITFINPVAEQLLRCTRAEQFGRPIADVIRLVDAETRAPLEPPVLAVFQIGTPVHLPDDVILIRHDGSEIFVHASAAPISTAPETILGAVMVFWDSTQRRQIEEARIVLQRQEEEARQLERLRVLAGGIAHDLNTTLLAVLGNAELALLDLPAEGPVYEALRQIEQVARRAATLTRQLLTYAGHGRSLIEPHNFNELVHETVEGLSHTVLKPLRRRIHLAPDLPWVDIDVAQIHQVVQNLLINAAEAIGETEGIITVTTDLRAVTSRDLAGAVIGANLPSGPYLSLEIADTGCGMDAATLARIFDPFFTTKFAGRGMGLAAVLGIVREHRGALLVESAVDQGTTFTLLLPLAIVEDITPSAPATAPPPWSGHGTVLVVDDDENVRLATAALLERLGLTVLTAADGRAGLQVFEVSPDTIDCVLLDVTMPGMPGTEVAHAIHQVRPDVPIVLMSGYSKEDINVHLVESQPIYFLPKPFQLADLRAQLLAIFARSGHPDKSPG